MAYVTTTQIKQTREALKIAFPDFKFLVRRSNGGSGSINVSIMSGPVDFANLQQSFCPISHCRVGFDDGLSFCAVYRHSHLSFLEKPDQRTTPMVAEQLLHLCLTIYRYLYRCWLVVCLWGIALGCLSRSIDLRRCI